MPDVENAPLDEIVEWNVRALSRFQRLLSGTFLSVAAAVVGFVLQSGGAFGWNAPVRRPRLKHVRQQSSVLPWVQISNVRGLLSVADGRRLGQVESLRVLRDRVVVVGPDPEQELHGLESLRVTSAECTSRVFRGKREGARWRIRAADGPNSVELQGDWLSLAWMGHLFGWAEPSDSADCTT